MNNVVKMKKNAPVYEQFCFLYQQQGSLDAAQLASIYGDDIVFKDPIHTIHGLPALTAYFGRMGENMNTCRFEFIDEIVTSGQAHITWNMRYSHKKIAGGKEQLLRGMTLIKFNHDKIIYHEDCYDVGAMVYEHLPLLGKATLLIKKRISG
jgi:hypothetical protein